MTKEEIEKLKEIWFKNEIPTTNEHFSIFSGKLSKEDLEKIFPGGLK